MIAAGLDIGGTKIALHRFGAGFRKIDSHEIATPRDYPALIEALVALCAGIAPDIPVGVSAAGQIHPRTGRSLTANLCATGKPIAADLRQAAARPIHWLNDAQAFVLSEAALGAGRGAGVVSGLVLGTGCGSAVAVAGKLLPRASGLGGEIGHAALAAPLVKAFDLPLLSCPCGRTGCFETLMSGPGLSRLCHAKTGRSLSAREIAVRRQDAPDLSAVWDVWCAIVADAIWLLQVLHDPDLVVIGGGISDADGVLDDITAAVARTGIDGFDHPRLALAEGGAQSGARGAALAAWRGADAA